MEVGSGTVLRAVLRQLSTAATIRNLPTPCRAAGGGRPLGGGDITPPLGVFMGLREAVSPWSDGLGDALLEVWDLDDGFALPPPLLELGSPIGGANSEASGGTPQPISPATPNEGQPFTPGEFAKLLVERLGSQQALLPLAAAVLAGGRRFPQARPRTCAAAPGSGRWMRFRQQRRGPASAVRRPPTRAPRQQQQPNRR